jgi:hypothetical protein
MLFLRLRPPPPSAAAPPTRPSTPRTPLPLVPAQPLHDLDHGRGPVPVGRDRRVGGVVELPQIDRRRDAPNCPSNAGL